MTRYATPTSILAAVYGDDASRLGVALDRQRLAAWYLTKARSAREAGHLRVAADYLDMGDALLAAAEHLEPEPVEDTGQHTAIFHAERAVKSALAEAISVRLLTEEEIAQADADPKWRSR